MRAGIFKIVRRLADQGLAILFISDEVSEVLMNSDRVVHMENGRLMGEYRPENTGISELEAVGSMLNFSGLHFSTVSN